MNEIVLSIGDNFLQNIFSIMNYYNYFNALAIYLSLISATLAG